MKDVSISNTLNFLGDLTNQAKQDGADASDAMMCSATTLSATWRLGKLEQLERSESSNIGLRVLVGYRQAVISSSEYANLASEELVERVVTMARAVPEDPFCGLALPEQLASNLPNLDICDTVEPTLDQLIILARGTEESGLSMPGITNSEGSTATWNRRTTVFVGSNGLSAYYITSNATLSTSLLAGDVTYGMERDYDYSTAVYLADLRTPEEVGRTAAARVLKRLGARKITTSIVPVVYESRVACSLLSHFLAAINGASVACGTTFLKESLYQLVFPNNMTIIDDPVRQRGIRSIPCDAEGLPVKRRTLVEHGILQSWILDLHSARQLGFESTGHAGRNTSGSPIPTPTNVYLMPSTSSTDALISDIQQGLYITELFSMGVNNITGDYSCGAFGFWIENGQVSYPVHEVTIAGNLKQMFKDITVANDLEFRYGIDSPTVRIESMTVAGR